MTARSATPWYRRWWALLLVFPLAALAIGGLLVFFFLFATIPLPDDIAGEPSVILDANGDRAGTLSAEVARQDIRLGNLPSRVPQAVMAAEDREFYAHSGISPTGVVRALFTNVRAGEIESGGSTITQQYIKNAALSSDRTFVRKAKEAALAVKVERRYSKDEILELYLNSIYLGRGAYGIEAAARTYFGIPSTELGLNQAATLAGMIQAPEAMDPAADPEGADRRRRYVLDGMLSEGWIDQAAHDRAVQAGLPGVRSDRGVESGADAYYLDAVRRELEGRLGGRSLYRGLTIHTALDPRLQRLAQERVREAVSGQPYTGALVSLDPTTGGVRALVGGPDYSQQQYNYALRGGSQTGSAFKPFTLATLVARGNSPASRVEAPQPLPVPPERAEQAGCQPPAEDYEANNYSRRGYGEVTARQATIDSINTAYMNLQLEVGCQAVVDTAASLGLPHDRPNSDLTPMSERAVSLTLGAYNFSPLEMASAYGTLAAEGVRARPHLVTRVVEGGDEVIHQVDSPQEGVYGANEARVVTDVLRDVVAEGTGTAAQIGRPVAGKTGTTSNYRDAWFVGYTPQLSTAVWIGGAERQQAAELEITGGSVPAETWAAFMQPAMEPLEVQAFGEPDISRLERLDPEPSPAPETSPSPTSSPSPTPTPTSTTPAEPTEPAEPTGAPTTPAEPDPTSSPTATEPTGTPTSQQTGDDQEAVGTQESGDQQQGDSATAEPGGQATAPSERSSATVSAS